MKRKVVRTIFDETTPTPRPVREAIGEWIRSLAPWTHFVHPTFARPVQPDPALKAFFGFGRAVAKRVGTHCTVAWAMERDSAGIHFHSLVALASANTLTGGEFEALWRASNAERELKGGRFYVEQYVPYQGGAGYLGKFNCWGIYPWCTRKRRCRRGQCRVDLEFKRRLQQAGPGLARLGASPSTITKALSRLVSTPVPSHDDESSRVVSSLGTDGTTEGT